MASAIDFVNMNAIDDAGTGGIAEYTRRTDEAEADEAELINEEKDFSVEFYLYFDNGLEYFVDDAKRKKPIKK